MENIINCDKCQMRFNETDNIPKLFPCCGVTYCLQCILKHNKAKDSNSLTCDGCEKKFDSIDQLVTNNKLLKIAMTLNNNPQGYLMSSTGNFQPNFNNSFSQKYQQIQMQQSSKRLLDAQQQQQQNVQQVYLESEDSNTRCMVHKHKDLEFFCKTCSILVCSNCMFYEHNGHALSQLEEINGLLIHNITDLSKHLQKSRTVVNLSRSQLEKMIQQVNFLEEQQVENIEKGFQAIMQRLNERKQAMLAEMSMRYLAEKRKFTQQLKEIIRNDEFLKDIEETYTQLVSYMEENHQVRILMRLNEISDFVQNSILKLDDLLKTEKQYDFKMDPTLAPMTLNVHRALEAIGKFHMNHPLQNDASFLKLKKENNGTDGQQLQQQSVIRSQHLPPKYTGSDGNIKEQDQEYYTMQQQSFNQSMAGGQNQIIQQQQRRTQFPDLIIKKYKNYSHSST